MYVANAAVPISSRTAITPAAASSSGARIVANALSSIHAAATPKHKKNKFLLPITNAPVCELSNASLGSVDTPWLLGLKKRPIEPNAECDIATCAS